MQWLTKELPWLMRPILGLLMITGIWTIITLIALAIEYFDDFKDVHSECFNYIVHGNKEEK